MKKRENKKEIPILSLKELADSIQPVREAIDSFTSVPYVEIDEDWKKDMEEENGYFFRMHKEYKIEIDWDQYNELQIQTLIALLYQYSDYFVKHWHKSDRAREDGADLVVEKGKDTISIAVKIKPKQEDRPQVLDLEKRHEKTKMYVYIQTPSRKFQDFMEEHNKIIKFYNVSDLNQLFISKNLGFTASLILDSHKISQSILETQRVLFGIRKKCENFKKKVFHQLDMQSFMYLWRLKDEAVSLHKTNENMIELLERPFNFKSSQLNEHFFKILIEYLDVLDTRLNSFLYYFKKLYERNEDLVNNSIISEIGRSHWVHIASYQTDNSLIKLEKELEKEIKYSKALKNLKQKLTDKELDKQWRERAKNNDIWEVMMSRVRKLLIFGSGVESIVDDIFREYIQVFYS